ncbi:MAG: TlpA family protein disulfide reductase [Acidobacteriota bacterium]|nr:TlpA family protein disulfide reductase [Acidobacteriota bacterium]
MKNSQNSFRYFAAVLIFLSAAVTPAQPPQQDGVKNSAGNIEYFGKFDAELIPDTRQLYRIMLKPAKNSGGFKFAQPPENGAKLAAGKIFDLRKSGGKFDVLLVESDKRAPSVCVDLNTDATFAGNECFAMIAGGKDNPNDFEYTLKLPIKTSLFNSFPLFLRYRRDFSSPEMQPGDRVLMQSLLAYAAGRVQIQNRPTLVQYQFDAEKGAVSTTEGIMGIDADGDGKIKNEPFSPETSYASKDEIVFRLGDLYLSTSRADVAQNQIVMRSRAPGEYRRVELEVGKPMPDFSFVDFEDKKRSLAEFRGKYLLVDFWGLWCVDCRRELPYQFEAYRRFRARGFEILGMDTDENTPMVKAVLQKNGIGWTQARHDSIKEMVENVYRIQEYPSSILLAPDGKVLVLDQSLLHGEQLLKTLDRILPPETR